MMYALEWIFIAATRSVLPNGSIISRTNPTSWKYRLTTLIITERTISNFLLTSNFCVTDSQPAFSSSNTMFSFVCMGTISAADLWAIKYFFGCPKIHKYSAENKYNSNAMMPYSNLNQKVLSKYNILMVQNKHTKPNQHKNVR